MDFTNSDGREGMENSYEVMGWGMATLFSLFQSAMNYGIDPKIVEMEYSVTKPTLRVHHLPL